MITDRELEFLVEIANHAEIPLLVDNAYESQHGFWKKFLYSQS
ncbi:hypothetical protein LEP1GSC103_2654 [Leptospira borgpetersenii serovar Javanica str. UI 09931]|uniref:Uncharacterized protein n=5 Tax=Leptospira borgpetersenii TaxID=174 RepID=M3HMZ2_LEPBO|nr:hypothetical protein LBBP_00171 [Leptospira borgpetersenii serovar Ballum]EKP13218.1 hypothetical protein LEP1GSC128_3491 [Leptospira borgpetersenii str. 200801926]EKQ92156.1 hypothetical protein LEP1GSC101_3000 [Leptospira borgpetersenii str. UI 09149]EKQ98762.1 hypothetical protein LEP1GSC121_0436 [Leptospira borgpetersenii serovar Castellonis str. 200801910]EMF99435.1 hypothetical protein LEP1GSC123_4855 [Leptospira borgpetersenii str. 200701203]EMK09318.1 hypothetical protein LEP1GSC066